MGKLSAEGLLQADDAKPKVVVVGYEIQRKQMQVKTLQQSHEILPSFFPLFQQRTRVICRLLQRRTGKQLEDNDLVRKREGIQETKRGRSKRAKGGEAGVGGPRF